MIIDSSGQVGIGTTAPGGALHVQKSAVDAPAGGIVMSRYWNGPTDTRASAIFHYYNTTSTSVDSMAFSVSQGNNPYAIGTIKMIIDSSGQVGIGTTAPNGKLEINSGAAGATTGVIINTTSVAANTYAEYKANGTVIGSITSAAGANVAFNTTSDVRLKGGFQPVLSPLKTLSVIEVSNFYYLLDPTHRQDGFKAQQLYQVLPYAVTKPEQDVDADGKIVPWLADYSKVVPLVTAAVQELYKRLLAVEGHQAAQDRSIASVTASKAEKAEVAQLKAENAALKSDSVVMKADIALMKAQLRELSKARPAH